MEGTARTDVLISASASVFQCLIIRSRTSSSGERTQGSDSEYWEEMSLGSRWVRAFAISLQPDLQLPSYYVQLCPDISRYVLAVFLWTLSLFRPWFNQCFYLTVTSLTHFGESSNDQNQSNQSVNQHLHLFVGQSQGQMHFSVYWKSVVFPKHILYHKM